MTVAELERSALVEFQQASAVYEGVLLGHHDFERGGRLLVLKAYKGPARALTVVELPGGSSCYEGIKAFKAGIWAQPRNLQGFDGFATSATVRVWQTRKLVADGPLTPARAFFSAAALLVIGTIAGMIALLRRMNKQDRQR